MSWCVNRIKITNPLTPARKSIIPSISHHPNNKRLIASGSLYLTYQIIRKVIHLAGRLPSQEVSMHTREQNALCTHPVHSHSVKLRSRKKSILLTLERNISPSLN